MIFKHIEKVVGIFVIGAIVAAITAILLIGNIIDKFKSEIEYKSEFKTVSGIDVGGKVYLKDLELAIGKITKYEVNERNMIDVWYSIEDKYIDKIREDSIAYLSVPPMGIGFATIKISMGYDPNTLEAGKKNTK